MFDAKAAAITYAAPINVSPALAPRAQGQLHLVAKRRGAETVIGDLRQDGSLKALFPRSKGASLDAVFLNTAGGLTGGDQMTIAVEAAEGAHVTLSSQAAERAYRAQPEQVARADVTLTAGPGARVDWLPQETIIFDGAALDRTVHVNLAPDATALIVEPIIFGRVAMGETVHSLHFTDHWRVHRAGDLVFADAVRLVGDANSLLQRKAVAAGAGAMATVLLAGPQAAGFAEMPLPADAGASLIADDLLLIRLLAADSFMLRRVLIPLIEQVSAAPIPRVWRL
ncbi:urease accessory protein UreD [Yoonia sp. SS1-5]|uniref:Urease accessory protein UreD n=1 Tax=Yoonia rhodophyticola TaxID=3137370 RepID=A0AAN0MCP4_9RHOB